MATGLEKLGDLLIRSKAHARGDRHRELRQCGGLLQGCRDDALNPLSRGFTCNRMPKVRNPRRTRFTGLGLSSCVYIALAKRGPQGAGGSTTAAEQEVILERWFAVPADSR
jgi:hypothetical protein